jgi:glyoxylase-like metal-dependent hydrolase (beta-lactamase superfamily II)
MEAVTLFREPTLVAMSRTEFDFVKPWIPLLAKGSEEALTPHFYLQEGELTVGDLRLQVIPTPGHSPGSLTFYWPEGKALFTGDLIFYQGLGRTDLPGGDGEVLKESIRRIAALEAEYLLSGHGPVIKGRKAVAANFKMVEEEWFAFI